MECIILAGGLGTRLRGVIGNTPKCMAPVNGRPFLYWLLRYLQKQGCTKAILSLGFGADLVLHWLVDSCLDDLSHHFTDEVIEKEPLGTGGAIRLAMQKAKGEQVLVVNGDTMFDMPLSTLMDFHRQKKAETSLALKAMRNFDRYGTVDTDAAGRILSFREKAPMEEGNINGGIYCIDRKAFLERELPPKFSFEKDYLEAFVGEGRFYGFEDAGYFIDIGVPQDYEQSQRDFAVIFGTK